jgi:hypothetical protein
VSKCNAWATKVCGDTRRNHLDSIKNGRLLSMAVFNLVEMRYNLQINIYAKENSKDDRK